MDNKQGIIFGIFKDGQLKGWRSDTFGTISDYPKFYTYSESQVETVIKNTQHMAAVARGEKDHPLLGILKDPNDPKVQASIAAEVAQGKAFGEFELRVIPYDTHPEYTTSWDSKLLPTQAEFSSWAAGTLPQSLGDYTI